MADDLGKGTDIACVNRLGKVFVLASGRQNLAMAIARRLITPRGGLFYDPNYGFSLVALLSAEVTAAEVLSKASAIEQEAEKDPRVLSAACTLDYRPADRTLIVTLALTDADGPFTLVLKANQLTVELLKVQ